MRNDAYDRLLILKRQAPDDERRRHLKGRIPQHTLLLSVSTTRRGNLANLQSRTFQTVAMRGVNH
jgi:hypothetical protein